MDNIIEIFAKCLRQSRKRAKLSMDELCNIMEPPISKQTISKYESGKCMPNGLLMFSLAMALKGDVDYFTRPFDFDIEKLNISFRKKTSMTVKELDALKVDVQDDIESYLEVEVLLGENYAMLEPLTKSAMSNGEDMRRMAQLLRSKWQLGNNPILNVQELLESKGVKVILIKGPNGFDGVSVVINKGSSQFFVVAINHSVDICERRQLTALHELGHLLFSDVFSKGLTPKKIET